MLVGIRTDAGVIDVIDTTSLTRVKRIPVDGSVHNVFVTPDGKYAVSGSIENRAATVIDLHNEQAIWEVKFDRAVRPMAFETNPDGFFKYSLPELKLLGYATLPEVHPLGRSPTGSVPEWITFTPDSKVVYVSNSGAGRKYAARNRCDSRRRST